ncbi:MAG: cation diffusion facilitator family transporter [Bacteroidales bacterium]
MELRHSHDRDIRLGTAFKIGITINIIFVIAEALSGFFSNSMALIADAGHNLSDVLALVFSWIAVIFSQRQPTLKFTYGFRRSTILVALMNTIVLLVAVIIILYETVQRLHRPVEINTKSVMIVAAIGIAVNGFTAWLFMKGKNNDLNIRSAFIHFVADALVSFGVVIGGVIMFFTGIHWIDSLVSFAIIAVILYSSYKLLINSVNLALDAVPENIKIGSVRDYLVSLPEVAGVHDLHIWSLGTTDAALTVHLTTCVQTDVSFIGSIQRHLHDQFKIEHSTIQVEYGSMEDCGNKF